MGHAASKSTLSAITTDYRRTRKRHAIAAAWFFGLPTVGQSRQWVTRWRRDIRAAGAFTVRTGAAV